METLWVDRQISNSEAETESIGALFAKNLPSGSAICLLGDLGTGKTVFARGLAKGLGVTDMITSPTFQIVNSYEYKGTDKKNLKFNHFDLYRIENPDELLEIGWDEYFDNESICLIEWPERACGYLPQNCYFVKLIRDEENVEVRVLEFFKKRSSM